MACVFCRFVQGKQKKNKSYPFMILRETKNTLSFLSINFPQKEDGHVLVIPKKHFRNIEDIPKKILHDLIEHTTLIAKTLRKTHEGCNFLLRDGESAGQTVLHTHFHIIPRDKGDKIKMEIWKRKKMKKTDFIELNDKIKKEIKKMGDKTDK